MLYERYLKFLDLRTPMKIEDVLGERRTEFILCCSRKKKKDVLKIGKIPRRIPGTKAENVSLGHCLLLYNRVSSHKYVDQKHICAE